MWDRLDPRSFDSRERDDADPRQTASSDPRDVFTQNLDLPRGLERERVHVHGHDYDLRGSEVRTLATVGAFRVVPLSDVHDRDGRAADLWHGDLDRLRAAGLIRVVGLLDHESRTPLLTLTDRGRDVLEAHRTRDGESTQTFYVGIANPRELRHDAHVFRAYLRSAERLQADGARLHRIVLGDELKRDYQRFLQERNLHKPDADGRPDRTQAEIHDWAYDHQLPVDQHGVQFPDVRIEFERSDGSRDREDIEVTTAHYRGAHAAAKVRAGFTRYRAGRGGIGGGRARTGGRAPDIRLAEELLE